MANEETGPAWERLEEQLGWHEQKSRNNKLWFQSLKVAQIVIAAAIPVSAAAGASATVAGALGAVIIEREGLQQLFEHEPGKVVLRQPLAQARRQQQLLVAIARQEVLGHGPPRRSGAPAMVLTRPDSTVRSGEAQQLQLLLVRELGELDPSPTPQLQPQPLRPHHLNPVRANEQVRPQRHGHLGSSTKKVTLSGFPMSLTTRPNTGSTGPAFSNRPALVKTENRSPPSLANTPTHTALPTNPSSSASVSL
jgi:hypothetical protein